MKKITLILVTILLIIIPLVNVYANDEMQLEISKTELNPGDELTVSVNFNTDRTPIYVYTAKLTYDEEIFEVIEKDDFEEQENWSEITYNKINNKFAITNKTGDESSNKVLKIKFKVKDNAKAGETTISLNNASVSNSTDHVILNGAKANVTIIKDGLEEGESLPAIDEKDIEIDDEDISLETEKTFPWVSLICVFSIILIIAILIGIFAFSRINKRGKILSLIIGIILTIILIVSAFKGANKKQKTDINQDGVVDEKDTVELMEYILEIRKPSEELLKNLDINNDGKVDGSDVADTVRDAENKNYDVNINTSKNNTTNKNNNLSIATSSSTVNNSNGSSNNSSGSSNNNSNNNSGSSVNNNGSSSSGGSTGQSNPSTPNVPGTTVTPVNPGTTTNPGTPSNPNIPTNPDNPSNPGTSTEPSNPTEPDVPTTPDNPSTPDTPTKPDNPNNPNNPSNPQNPEGPSIEDTYSSNVTESRVNTFTPKKGEKVILDLYIDVKPYSEVKSLRINEKFYEVQKVSRSSESNHYQVTLDAFNKAGVQKLNITDVKLANNITVRARYTILIDILKDKPTVENFKIDDKKEVPEISFTLNDPDKACKTAKFIIKDEEGNVVFESKFNDIKIGENKFAVNLSDGKTYHYDFDVEYDLDHNALDESIAEDFTTKADFIDDIFENKNGDLKFIREYGFEAKNLNLTSKVSKNEKLILSFENAKESYYDVKVIVVNDKEYAVQKENNVYKVELPKETNYKNQITLQTVRLENGYEASVNQTLEYSYIKEKPSIESVSTKILEGKVNFEVNTVDEENSIISVKALVKDENNNVVKTVELQKNQDSNIYSGNTDITESGSYKVEIEVTYNIGNGEEKITEEYEEKIDSPIIASFVQEKSNIPTFVKKGENVEVTYVISDNTNKEVTHILVNNVKLPTEKVNDETYKVTFKAPTQRPENGIFDVKATRIYYGEQEIQSTCNLQTEILKSELSIENLSIDDSEVSQGGKPKVRFSLTDLESTFVSGNIIIKDLETNDIQKMPIIKHASGNIIQTYELENIEEFKNYNISLEITYDLDNDNNNEKNENTKTFVSHDFNIQSNYNLTLKDVKFSLDSESGKVILKFSSENSSQNYIEKVLIGFNGVKHEYKTVKDDNTYTIEIPLEKANNTRTEITLEELILNNLKVFNKNTNSDLFQNLNPIVVFKDKPTATIGELSVNSEKTVITAKNIDFTDKDNTLSKKYAVLKLNNEIINKVEITDPNEIKFTSNEIYAEGTYFIQILADYEINDAKSHLQEAISDEKEVKVGVNLEITSVSAEKYAQKGKTAEITFTVKSNTSKDIQSVEINGILATNLHKDETGAYKAEIVMPQEVGNKEFKVTKVVCADEELEIKNNPSVTIFILKDKLSVSELRLNLDNIKPILSFKITDDDMSFVSGRILITDTETGEQTEVPLTKDNYNYNLDVAEYKKYSIELKITYDLDFDINNNENQAEESFGIQELYFVKEYELKVSDLVVLNVDRTDNRVTLQFKSTNKSIYDLANITVGENSYLAKKVENTTDTYTFDYMISNEQLGKRTEIKIDSVSLTNNKKLEVTDDVKTVIFKTPPIANNIKLENVQNTRIKVTYDVKDDDKTLSKLYIVLKDEQGNTIEDKTVEKDIREVNFNVSEAKKYKVEILGDFNLVDGLSHSREKLLESENEVEIVPTAAITTNSVSNRYPNKGETVEISYKILSNVNSAPTKVVVNDNSEYDLQAVGTPNDYKMIFKVADYATTENININKIYFANGQTVTLSQAHQEKVEVLKAVPTVNITSTDHLNQNIVSFIITITDQDNAVTGGKASIHAQEISLHSGSNPFNVTVEPDEEHTLNVEVDYDLDNDELTAGTEEDHNTNKITMNKNFTLVSDYKLTVSNLATYKTESNEPSSYFTKGEQIQLRFNSSNSTSYEPETVVVNDLKDEKFEGTEYQVKKVQDGSSEHQYYVDIVTNTVSGLQELTIDSVKLNSSKVETEFEGKDLTAKFEVLKDKPTMTDYTSTNHENSIIVKFNITDTDNALLESKLKLIDVQSDAEVKSETITVGANTHTFENLETGKQYKIILENNFSLREDRQDVQNEIVKEEQLEITDKNNVDFRMKNLSISERVPTNSKVHISFENGVLSYKDVDSITINDIKYPVTKGNDNIYKLDLDPGEKGVNILRLQSVGIGTKTFEINRNLRYVHEKVLPTAIEVTDINENTKDNLAIIKYKLVDEDSTVKSLKAYMKNSAGSIIATSEDISEFSTTDVNTLEMPLLKLNEYHIELRANHDIGDGETFEETALFTKSMISESRATVVEQTIDKEYSNKEEEVTITVKLNTNVDQEVRKIYIGEDAFDAVKVKNEKGEIVNDTYTVTLISPKKTGIFEQRVTKVQIGNSLIDTDHISYAEGVEPCNIQVLKDKPTLTHFMIAEDGSKATFKINDLDESLAKPHPKMIVKDMTNNGKVVAEKDLTKGGKDYEYKLKELGMTDVNHNYNITVDVSYDLKPTEKVSIFRRIANFITNAISGEENDESEEFTTTGTEKIYDETFLLTSKLTYKLDFKDGVGYYFLTRKKDDDDSAVIFDCTTGTPYKVVKVIINDKEYNVEPGTKEGNYRVLIRAENINLNWITYQKVILENGVSLDIPEKDGVSRIPVRVVQETPTFNILEYSEDVKEKKVRFRFKLVDEDEKMASEFTFKLMDSQNGLIAEKEVKRTDTTVEFDIPNPPTAVYKLQVRAKLYEVPGYDGFYIDWPAFDGDFKSSVNSSILGSKFSTVYPSKGETITIDYTISSTTVIKIDPEDHTNQDKAVGISYLVINGKDYDVQTLDNEQYRVYYTADNKTGVQDVDVSAIKFTNGTTEEFIRKDQIDVLKDMPEIRNYKVENQLDKNKVKFSFDLVDNDHILTSNNIYARVNDNDQNVNVEHSKTVTHNELEFNAKQDELSKFEVFASFDLDTDILKNETSSDDNSYIDKSIFEKPFMLTGDYSVDIKNIETYNSKGEKTEYFEKNEDILVKFESTTKVPELCVETVKINDTVYEPEKDENNIYTLTIKGSDKAGKVNLPISSVTLNSGNEIEIKNANINYEILKDVVKVKELKSAVSDNGDIVNVDINIEDNDKSNNKLRLEIKDEYNQPVNLSTSDLNVGTNRVTFEKTSAEKYFATIYSDYDRDLDKTNNPNHYTNMNIYYQIISINTRYIEMKDIVDIALYKFGDDGRAEKVNSLTENNLQVLENCLVKVSMRNIAPFYSNITDYNVENGKLRLVLAYTDAMVFTGKEELKPLEVTLDILEGSSSGYQYDGSFQSLVDKMRLNPTGTFDLDKDYDLDEYAVNTNSKAIIDFEFKGTLNGHGHTISNLHKPFFSLLKDATIENIVFRGTDFINQGSQATVVLNANHSNLSNLNIDLVTIRGGNNNAGIAYEITNGSVIDKCNVVNLNFSVMYSNQNNAGAVVSLKDSTIQNCYIAGTMPSGWQVNSGFVAQASGNSNIINNIVNLKVSPYFGNEYIGNGGILARGTATLKNNLSLMNTNSKIYTIYNENKNTATLAEGSKDNYQLKETNCLKNTLSNAVKEVDAKDIDSSFFKKLDFSDQAWVIDGNTSINNLPVLKSVSASFSDDGEQPENTEVYIPDYNRVHKLPDYDSNKEIVYHNMYKIMPFYDAKEIIRDGNKIPADNELSTKIVKYVIPYDKSGKMISSLTTENYNSLNEIRIVFTDKTSKKYHIDFDDYYGNVASYMISDLNVGYNYNKYIINPNLDIINYLVTEASSYTYDNDLEPIVSREDSRLYKEHFENYTKNHIKDFIINTLVNMDYSMSFESEVLDNLIKQDLVRTGKLKNLLFAYNYFTYWYNLDMDGINVADSIMFHANEMFDNRMTMANITNELITGTNSATNGTAGFYNNGLAKYTKLTNLGLFLDYYVQTLTHYTDGNTWFKEHWKGGRYYTVSIDKEGVDYTLWDHLKKDGKVQNDFLPLCTVPENSTYAIASPTQAYFGSLRVYMTDPSNPDQIAAFEKKVNVWLKEVKAFYEFGYTYWGKDTLNKYCDVNYDMRTTYTGQGNATVYNNPLTTQEPYHKYFIEAINRWAGTSGGAYANGNEVFWVVIKMLDNFRVGTHETLHNQDSKIFLNGYGRRGGAEDYAAGFLQQYYRDGWVSPNIFDDDLMKENSTQNFYRATVENDKKLSVFYKNYFNTNDFLDWIEAKAFFTLSPEDQAKLAVQVSYPQVDEAHQDEGDDVVAYTPLTTDRVQGMNLKSMEALWDNRIMLRPGVKEYEQRSPGADTDSIFNIHWYQPHADNDRPDGANFKYLAWQMAGERGYYDGLCAYYSQKYVGIKNGKGGNTTDLTALRYIMNDDKITFREYKLNRYKELGKHYEEQGTYINAKEIYEKYLEALIKDAQSGNRNLSNSTAVKKQYFRQIQKETEDFTINPFDKNPNAKSISLELEDNLLNITEIQLDNLNITNTVENTIANKTEENTDNSSYNIVDENSNTQNIVEENDFTNTTNTTNTISTKKNINTNTVENQNVTVQNKTK